MPITLVTGVPGSGKTLHVIALVEKLREETGRPVYYSHIPALTLPWHPMGNESDWRSPPPENRALPLQDPDQVHRLPQGSIVVMDEAWSTFPNRPAGSPRPSYILAFAEHRHRGHDFVFMAQSSGQLDQFIRGMVGRHVHLERKFGLPRARMWSWESKLGEPGDWHSKQEATASEFLFPKKFYGCYKSADVHTVQQRMPWLRLGAIAGAMVLAVVMFVMVIGRFLHKKTDAAGSAAQAAAVPSVSTAHTAAEFDRSFAEVSQGEPYSPTFYRSKLSAATLPKISGCLEMQIGGYVHCQCNTQEGTVIRTMTYRQCHDVMRYGWFDFTRQHDEEAEAARVAALPRGSLGDAERSSVSAPALAGGAPPAGLGGAAPGAAAAQ